MNGAKIIFCGEGYPDHAELRGGTWNIPCRRICNPAHRGTARRRWILCIRAPPFLRTGAVSPCRMSPARPALLRDAFCVGCLDGNGGLLVFLKRVQKTIRRPAGLPVGRADHSDGNGVIPRRPSPGGGDRFYENGGQTANIADLARPRIVVSPRGTGRDRRNTITEAARLAHESSFR